MNDAVNLIGLAKQLVEPGLLDEKKAADAVLRAKQNKMSLVTFTKTGPFPESIFPKPPD